MARRVIYITALHLVLWGSIAGPHPATADPAARPAIDHQIPFGIARLPFVANHGQLHEAVGYYAPIQSGAVHVTRRGEIIYQLAARGGRAGVVLKENFVGGSAKQLRGLDRAVPEVHSFKGSDPSLWRTDIPTYTGISFGEVYPGIEVTLASRGTNVEKLFHIAPGVDAEAIRMNIEGATELRVTPWGELEALTDVGVVAFGRPAAYQERDGVHCPIEVAYVNAGTGYGFAVGPYDSGLPLTIDPLLAATFLGGTGDEGDPYGPGFNILPAGDGSVYVACVTLSTDFPTSPGAYSTSHNGNYDIAIARFDEDLSVLQVATFLGGTNNEMLPQANNRGIAIDEDGDLVIGGFTTSSDFPTTPGAYDRFLSGTRDAFVARMSADLATLEAATLLGGFGDEIWCSMVLDDAGTAYVAGITTSGSGFPTTVGAYDRLFNGVSDFFVSRFNPELTQLLASTFLGGQSEERPPAIELDPAGRVVVASGSDSPDYPTTDGAYSRVYSGNTDIVISVLSSDLTSLLASTYVGRSSFDGATVLAVDENARVYVGGHTQSLDYPATPGAYDQTHNGFNDYYVTKLDPDLTVIESSTFLSGVDSTFMFALDLALGSTAGLYVVGHTDFPTFPTTVGAYDRTFNGGWLDGALMLLDRDLSTLEVASFLGGSGDETVVAIAIGDGGDVFLAGNTASADFPTTPGAYDPIFNGGGRDCFAVRMDAGLSAGVSAADPPDHRARNRLPDAWHADPFMRGGSIEFHLPQDTYVWLDLTAADGRRIRGLTAAAHTAGGHSITWDGRDGAGRMVPSGSYFYRLRTTHGGVTRKLVLVR